MYFNFIDLTKLSRNYESQPLSLKEDIPLEDFKYLYIEENLTKKEVAQFFKCSANKVKRTIDENNFKKDNKTIAQSQRNMLLRTKGVTNCMKLPDIAKKCHESFAETMKIKKDEVVQKRRDTLLARTGYINPSMDPEIKKKKEKTCLKHWGVTNQLKSKEIKDKVKNTYKQRYGGFTLEKSSILRDKYDNTMIERYSVNNPLLNSEIRKRSAETLKSKTPEIKRKNLIKYGVEWPSQLERVKFKINETKRKNKTFNTSILEETVYNLLNNRYTVIRQYECEKYPHKCDFYIKELDLFIEVQGHWSHGKMIYDPNNKECIKKLHRWKEKAKTSKYYQNAIKTWTYYDVLKREHAKKNKLNWIEFFKLKDILEWYDNQKLNVKVDEITIDKEFKKITTYDKNGYESGYNWNQIVLYFQWKEYYKKELQLWDDNNDIKGVPLHEFIYENRNKYLGKELGQLTDKEILRAFKISGIHIGNSMHSPFYIKQFIKDYNIKSIYDPTGGWGHRLLGAHNISYIYNDINTNTFNNCKKMCNHFSLQNKVFYNNDCSTFTPNEEYEAIFTCPPYWNTEIYSTKGAENLDYENFLKWWNKTIEYSFLNKESCKYFAFIINQRFKDDLKLPLLNKYTLLKEQIVGKPQISHLQHNKNTSKCEYLIIFGK